jgi:valyl-tRNA synthetase
MDKTYDHKKYEDEIYKMWERGGYFTAKRDPKKKPYTIVLPPPNASGKMHTGNVLMIAIEDLLIRWKRMQGYSALWIPGTDHAGFETQITFERELKKKGKSRFDFDRKTLYEKIWNFVQENKGLIEKQIKSMGASVDWSRYKFTLDPDVIDTVIDTFIKLDNDGLLYKDDYMVNYCPVCGTTFADLEVKHIERKDPLYFVRYLLVDKNENEPEFVVVATVRPEPIFVDTHLAVNPKDNNNNWLVGRKVKNPLTDKVMDIISDNFVDPEFGTGVVKLTPAHDKNDYEVAKNHNLPIDKAFDLDGKMLESAGEFSGMFVSKARKHTVEMLNDKNLIEKIDENYYHSVAVCYKGGHDIEPTILPNWFVRVAKLKKPAHDAVKNGVVKIYPSWQEIKFHRWMESMQDWPISRQVVWGIRIPVWYKTDDNENLKVSFLSNSGKVENGTIKDLIEKYSFKEIESGLQTLIAPKDAKFVISKNKPDGNYLQETDTFDTWFSSGQWPLLTLGYPNSPDCKYFYPNTVLETGWEILRLWVSRMIMFGIYLTGKPPFSDVYLHGLVRAIDGRKMSKSLGNVINPDEYLEKYGADALRMGLVSGTANGKDFNFPHDKVIAYQKFGNKIWNMARFMNIIFEQYEEGTKNKVEFYSPTMDSILNKEDKNIIKVLEKTIGKVNKSLEKYRFTDASEAIYHFMWDDLASNYIEHVKNRKDKDVALSVLRHVYVNSIKLLHPFMPFVTEAIWQQIPKKSDAPLIISRWPEVKENKQGLRQLKKQ